MQTKDNFIVGFFGHTEEDFHSLFSEVPERYAGEIQRYYEIWLMSQIRQKIDAGATSFITTIQDGVCNWIANQIVTNNNLHPEDHIELWVVLPPDLKKRKYFLDEWTIMTCADGRHIAEGTEREDILRCMMEECDQMLLFTADTQEGILYQESAAGNAKLDTFNPIDVIEKYCMLREKHKLEPENNVVDLSKYQAPFDD